jgi:hypothetical protein
MGYVLFGDKFQFYWDVNWKQYFIEKLTKVNINSLTSYTDVNCGDIIIYFQKDIPVHMGIVHSIDKDKPHGRFYLHDMDIISKIGVRGILSIDNGNWHYDYWEADRFIVAQLKTQEAWLRYQLFYEDKRRLSLYKKEVVSKWEKTFKYFKENRRL